MKKKEELSKKDKVQWEEYLKDPKDIFDKELDNKTPPEVKYRFSFDLHGFTLLGANQKVYDLIINCQEKGFSEILLITGKGLHSNVDRNTYVSKDLSKLRFAIPEYLNSQKDLSDKIIEICQADVKDGGEGAMILKLKKL